MKTALILNGSKKFGSDGTRLNFTMHKLAKNKLEASGYKVLETIIDQGYEPKAEMKKMAEADLIIYQMPAWWMGVPWIVKKYIDEVLMEGYEVLFTGDGRTRKDSSKKYGSGGLAKDKRVVFSTTWNAPLEAFTDPAQFFEGKGAEAVYFWLRKTHEFLGMKVLPVFMCNDVQKNPQIDKYTKEYEGYFKTHVL